MNGFELHDMVLEEAKASDKIIPFIFMSTSADRAMMKQHCQKSFHGYFEKRSDFNEIRNLLDQIISYWKDGIPSG